MNQQQTPDSSPFSDNTNPADKTLLDESLYSAGRSAAAYEKTELLTPEAPPPLMAWLVVVSEGPRHGEMLRIQAPSTMIGRSHECEIAIDDRAASRQHAKIRVEGSGDQTRFVLHDLATDNGTFVNGQRISSVELQNNDLIRIGRTEMTFKRI